MAARITIRTAPGSRRLAQSKVMQMVRGKGMMTVMETEKAKVMGMGMVRVKVTAMETAMVTAMVRVRVMGMVRVTEKLPGTVSLWAWRGVSGQAPRCSGSLPGNRRSRYR
jgi:hypothetical protein